MHDEHSTPQSTEHAEELGYEDSDVSIPILLKWGFYLVVFVVGTSLAVLGFYAWLVPQYLKPGANTAIVRKMPDPTMPQVQPDPVKDIKKFRSDETTHITGYGTWKDGDGKDVTYIPIDRAMQIVEAKGLPIESQDAAKDDVTPPAVDRGFLDNPLPDGRPSPVQGKVGPENGDSMDESSYAHHTPGM